MAEVVAEVAHGTSAGQRHRHARQRLLVDHQGIGPEPLDRGVDARDHALGQRHQELAHQVLERGRTPQVVGPGRDVVPHPRPTAAPG